MKLENRNSKLEGSLKWNERSLRRVLAAGVVRHSSLLRTSSFAVRVFLLIPVLFAFSAFAGSNAPAPGTTREFYNAGTQMLKEGKLREAETFLETAVSHQDDRLQPEALYNLGHVRFAQGAEELKKAPNGHRAAARGQQAAGQAQNAIREVDQAMASKDMQRMVSAYLQGRGARKELRAAAKAVQKAMEAYASVLLKWQRASGDFKSAAELDPSNTDSTRNAEIVDRHIARLIDSLQEMQAAMAAMQGADQQLGEKLKQLRGQIPDSEMPPGAPGDDEEEEDMPDGLQPGMKEGPSKPGHEMQMSPEQAEQLLNGYRLDGDRRLPMGEGEDSKPKEGDQRNW